MNANGVDDHCDTDSEASSIAYGAWRAIAGRPDTFYVGVLYKRQDRILVNYTVPSGSHRVRISAKDSASGHVVVLRDDNQTGGAYTLEWVPKGTNGAMALSGDFEIDTTIGRQSRALRVMWRWRKHTQ
jgi:hypothetical protein